jgi:hypothetical protein
MAPCDDPLAEVFDAWDGSFDAAVLAVGCFASARIMLLFTMSKATLTQESLAEVTLILSCLTSP